MGWLEHPNVCFLHPKMNHFSLYDRLTQHWFGEPNIPTISGTLYLLISYNVNYSWLMLVISCYIWYQPSSTSFDYPCAFRVVDETCRWGSESTCFCTSSKLQKTIQESWFGLRFFIALTTKNHSPTQRPRIFSPKTYEIWEVKSHNLRPCDFPVTSPASSSSYGLEILGVRDGEGGFKLLHLVRRKRHG